MTSLIEFARLGSVVAVILSAACTPTAIIKDRLDTFVLVGFGMPDPNLSDCTILANENRAIIERSTNCGERAWRIRPGESVRSWAWSVNSRDLTRPQPGKRITFSVVDRDGARVPTTHARVTPHTIVTGENGLTQEVIQLTAGRPGVYRIRANYADRSAQGYAYSPNVIVQTY